MKCKVFYLGSEVESEARMIYELYETVFFGPTIPADIPNEKGEKILGMYIKEEDALRGAWNLDGCDLIEIETPNQKPEGEKE